MSDGDETAWWLGKILLSEVETAHALGFRRFRQFAFALRRGSIPRPDVELPDGPRWSAERLRAWLRGEDDGRSLGAEQRRIIRRLEGKA